jgi:hypothetical protein
MQKTHGLRHCFFTNFRGIALQQKGRDPGREESGRAAYEPVTLAPPKRSFQRGITSRL